MPRGCFPSRNNWTDEEVLRLDEYLRRGWSDKAIGSKLKRSRSAVIQMRKKRKLAPRLARAFSAKAVAKRMGLSDTKPVIQWIERGWLRARRCGHGTGKSKAWRVTLEALYDFVADPAHWHLWDLEQVTDMDLRVAAEQRSRLGRLLTVGEVSDRFHVVYNSVDWWIHHGYLKAVRRGHNWMVWEADLAGFVPPSMRPRKGWKSKRFTPQEDRQLLQLRASRESWCAIGRQLNRNPASVADRWRRLQARAEAERQTEPLAA